VEDGSELVGVAFIEPVEIRIYGTDDIGPIVSHCDSSQVGVGRSD
jgi:hypothetical protein